MKNLKQFNTRFDMKLSLEQKQLFERASVLGGYKNLTHFIITTILNKANDIIKKSEEMITLQANNELFFNAVMEKKIH